MADRPETGQLAHGAIGSARVTAFGGRDSHPVAGDVPELPVRHDDSMDKSPSSYRLSHPTCRLRLEAGVR